MVINTGPEVSWTVGGGGVFSNGQISERLLWKKQVCATGHLSGLSPGTNVKEEGMSAHSMMRKLPLVTVCLKMEMRGLTGEFIT